MPVKYSSPLMDFFPINGFFFSKDLLLKKTFFSGKSFEKKNPLIGKKSVNGKLDLTLEKSEIA